MKINTKIKQTINLKPPKNVTTFPWRRSPLQMYVYIQASMLQLGCRGHMPVQQLCCNNSTDHNFCMISHGIALYHMILHGILWHCLIVYGITLIFDWRPGFISTHMIISRKTPLYLISSTATTLCTAH